MIKAGSLYYAIMICVLVGICCAAFMLTSHYSRMHSMILQSHTELLTTNHSAGNYFLGRVDRLNNSSESLDLFDNGIESNGNITNWGFYKVLKVSSVFKNDTVVSHSLLGEKSKPQSALYLVDNDKPLQMVGKAKIKGDAYLPKKGIKKGYITTQSFSSYTFLEGNKLRSDNKLPTLKGIFAKPDTLYTKKLHLEEIENDDVIYQSFNEKTLEVKVNTFSMSSKTILGNVVISSKDSLFITRNNTLEDVLIMAPIVIFEKGFTGTVQVFGSQKVELQEDVVLKYPSGIFMDGDHLERREVIMNEDCKLLGSVVVSKSNNGSKGVSLITIQKQAEVIGNVYCDGSTQLKGSVIGSLYTDNFYLKTKASSYENYIENGLVDLKSLSEEFLGNSFSDNKKNSPRYAVIKTL
jgi:hypothetical protein